MKSAIIAVVVVAVVGAGIWYAFGGGEAPGVTAPVPAAQAATVVAIGDLQAAPETYLGQTVAVEGRITRHCPTTGCWWYVQDATGEIRADSSATGFALPPGQDGKQVLTTGKVTRNEGGELELTATGATVK
ncbi:MAG TPA: OB-fold nucleic acid binding domain-containing protein [Chthonomonadales bacterium]|nr:OB-fold nucleic acid binding domain-containing protein [Chthonomonadales bacterium]